MKAIRSVLCILLIFSAVGAVILFPPKIIPSEKQEIEFLDFKIEYDKIKKACEIATDIANVSKQMIPRPILELTKAYYTPIKNIAKGFAELASAQ